MIQTEKEAAREMSRIYSILEERQRRNKLRLYFAETDQVDENGVIYHSKYKYPKQMELMRRGADVFARMFLAGNGVGKTETALYEIAHHMRGVYPDGWEGRRFNHPVDVWICGETSETVRGIQQLKLLGHPYKEGTGMMPIDWIDLDSITRSGVPGAIDTFCVPHISGGVSHGQFKSYKQGVAPFFGPEKHIIHLDELPPANIYSECVARTRNRPGAFILVTCSPKKGNTETVKLFREKDDPSRIIVTCGWADVPHLSEDWKAKARANTAPYLLAATEFGEVGRGAGAVYPIEESQFIVEPFPIPKHWLWMWAMDGGYHNTAAGWYAYARDSDVMYMVSEYKDGGDGTDLSVHATRFKARCKALGYPNMPGVGDAAAISQIDGKKLLTEYQNYDLNLRLAIKSVDVGIGKTLARLNDGKLKVFSTCTKFLDEFRNYSYEVDEEGNAGRIVKVNDHLMDQLRYAVMSVEKIADSPRQAPTFKELSFG